MHQYIAVGTERMFIEPSASRPTTIARLINSPYYRHDSSCCSCYTVKCYDTIQYNTILLSATIQYNTIQYNTLQYSVQWWSEEERWLCRVEVNSEQVSLESFSEDSERLCGPESGRELIPPLRSQNREKL